MAETFQPIRSPVCKVITDLKQRREMHARKRRTSTQALAEDLKDSLKVMSAQTEANTFLLEQDKQLVMDAMSRLAKRTSEGMMQAFVTNVMIERQRAK